MSRQTEKLQDAQRGTMVLVELSAAATAALVQRLANHEPVTLRLMLEVMPGAEVHYGLVDATLKACADRGTWSPPLAQVQVGLGPLYDAP